MTITNNQALFAAPLLTEGLLFVGEFRGYAARDVGYKVRDRDGKVTGEASMEVQQFLVEIQPSTGMPVPMLCELVAPRGEETKKVTAQKGNTVLVVVKQMEFNKYQQRIIVKVSAVHELSDVEPAKEYKLNEKPPEKPLGKLVTA